MGPLQSPVSDALFDLDLAFYLLLEEENGPFLRFWSLYFSTVLCKDADILLCV